VGIVIILRDGFQERRKVLSDPSCSLAFGAWKCFAKQDDPELVEIWDKTIWGDFRKATA